MLVLDKSSIRFALRGLMVLLGTFAAAGALLAQGGRFSGHLDVLTHFALIYLAAAAVVLIGAMIAALGVPVLFVMEGGYAIEAIGVNAVNVLKGFAAARD